MRVLIPLTGLLVLLTVALGLLAVFLSEAVFLIPFVLSLGVMLTLALFTFLLASRYRAPEGTAGIVYRRGFFYEIIRPGQTVYLIPLLERVEMEVDLRRQTTTISRRDIYTVDGYPMNAYVQVLYRVDPELLHEMDKKRWAQIHQRRTDSSDAVRPPERFWQGLVQNVGGRLLAETVSIFRFEKLKPNMWALIDAQMQAKLQDVLNGWGVVVEKVIIQDLRPGRQLEPAVQKAKRALSEAEALSTQLQALLAPVADNGDRQVSAQDLLLAMLAHRAGQSDAHLPPIVLPSPNGGNNCDDLLKLLSLLLKMLSQESTTASGKGSNVGGTAWQSKKAS